MDAEGVRTGKRILLLDGETRAALAVLRSLGRAGYEVAVCSAQRQAIAFSSRYASVDFQYPSPEIFPDRFIHWLTRTIDLWQPHCLIPVTDLSLSLVLEYESTFRESTILPVVSKEVFEDVSDKARLCSLAQHLGVFAPKTKTVSTGLISAAQIHAELAGFSYPVVVKPRRSINRTGAGFVRPDIYYAHSAAEVVQTLEAIAQSYPAAIDYLIQEKVSGVGVGVFALCVQGEVLCSFAHQRLLEKPPSGGRSVLSTGIAPEQAPMQEAFSLLQHYKWNGVAMVEFKRQEDGRFCLMEINPRFWGSLQLAIDSGRDFPTLLVDLACAPKADAAQVKARIQELPPYTPGRRLRWLLGTLDHLLIRLKQDPLGALRDVLRANSLEVFKQRAETRFELIRISDLRPFFTELRSYLRELLGWSR